MKSNRPSRTLGLLTRCVPESVSIPLPAQPVLRGKFLGRRRGGNEDLSLTSYMLSTVSFLYLILLYLRE